VTLRRVMLAAPVIFIAHFLDEGADFVTWFNAHVARGITEQLFWMVNYSALALTLAVTAMAWAMDDAVSDVAVVVWLNFLFGANAVLHIVASVADGKPMPGLLTAVLLYVPFYIVVMRLVTVAWRVPSRILVPAALLGAAPMLLHGYLIVFRGSRLF
jgi:hypothetical protein